VEGKIQRFLADGWKGPAQEAPNSLGIQLYKGVRLKLAMKTSLSVVSRGFFVSVFLSVALAVPVVRADDHPPTVAKAAASANVTVTDNGNTWTLDNGIVKATVSKRSGNMPSLVLNGIETMSLGGVWEETPELAPHKWTTVTIDPATNGGDRAEVSVKGITDGKVMLTPSAPGGGTYCDIEIRCSLGRGDSGVYTYAIFSHPGSYGAMQVGESRFITFLSRTFDWITVDADRNMLECAPTDWGTGVVVHAKEQRIMSKGIYKNSVEHKYSYNAIQYKLPAYGWSSTKDHVGVWFINPTIEYLSGGASKQELVCHYHDNDDPEPIILDYWRGTHYGGGASCTINAGEQWSKVIGPIFVYCNQLSNPKAATQAELDTLAATAGNPTLPESWKENATALWQDALGQAKVERAKWPYDWVNGVDYPHKDGRGTVTGQIVLNDPQAATTALPHLMVGLAHPDYARGTGGGRGGGFGRAGGGFGLRGRRGGATTQPGGLAGGFGRGGFGRGGPTTGPAGGRGGFGFGFGGGNALVDWTHDAKFYEFWNDGTEDGKFTLTNVRPGTYTLHAFADGVLGELAQANITVEAGKTLDLGQITWTPVRYGKQVWEIGYPDRTGDKFFKGDGDNYWLWGWPLRYPLLFPNDITYTIGQSDYHKDWFFEEVPHATSLAFLNPDAKDPANQRFGWVKAESLKEYPQTNTTGPWRIYGRGRATTWTIKFNMDDTPKGQAALRVALAGADGGGGLAIGVNGKSAGMLYPVATNALRYNTNKSVWQELTLKFDASMMKQGENEMTLTVPAGEVTSGVVWDYLRLELNEDYKPG
jgi:rhamnogalacturonan endolyase